MFSIELSSRKLKTTLRKLTHFSCLSNFTMIMRNLKTFLNVMLNFFLKLKAQIHWNIKCALVKHFMNSTNILIITGRNILWTRVFVGQHVLLAYIKEKPMNKRRNQKPSSRNESSEVFLTATFAISMTWRVLSLKTLLSTCWDTSFFRIWTSLNLLDLS